MIEADEFVAGDLCLDFVNTVGGDRTGVSNDKLESYSDLLDWAALGGALSKPRVQALRAAANTHPEAAARMLRRAKQFREALHGMFHALSKGHAPPRQALDAANAEIGASLAHARLSREGNHFSWSWDEAGGFDAPLWPVARNAGDLLTSKKLGRIGECGGDTCGWLFLDLTKNKSRRWCDMRSCGNRAKVRRYRAQ